LPHYICFVVVAHHVPHTTVPANRPHRPVSAPPKRSPRAETGQPVRTQYGVRGRRLARRLHPCAPAARPPFDARPKWSSALKRWTLRKIALLARGAAGNSLASKGRVSRKETTGVRRLRQNLPSLGGADQEAPCAGRLAPDRFSIRAALVEPASRQTGKQAECPACRRLAVQARYRHGRRSAVALPSDQPGGLVSTQECGLSNMQACRRANRHTGRKADGHDCGQDKGVL
jgi:hypothetical protein